MTNLKAIFKNKDFLYLWISQFTSQVAVNTLTFLIILQIFNATGSAIASSLVWVTFIIPAVLFGPFAAAFADMVDKKAMLMFTNLFQGLTILIYAFLFQDYLYLAYGVVFTYSFFNQFYIPAELASLPMLVKKENLASANGLFLITYQLGIIVGYGLSGAFSQLVGFRTSFLVAAGLLFAALASVSLLPKLKEVEKKTLEKGVSLFFNRVAEGYHFIRQNKNVFSAFVIVVTLQVSLAIIMVNLPLMAREILGVSPSLAGLFIVLPAGLGAVLGAIIVPRLLIKWRKKKMIENSLLLTSAVVWSIVLLVPETALFLRPLITSALSLLVGISFVGIYIPAQTYMQVATPEMLMGRVFGNTWFITTVATVLPVLFSATVSEIFGVRQMFFLLGTLTLGMYFLAKRHA
jgi:MFS family permease